MVCGTSYLSDDDVAALPPAVHRRLCERITLCQLFLLSLRARGFIQDAIVSDSDSRLAIQIFFAAMSTAVIGDDAPAHLACSEGTKTSLTTRNPGP